MAAKETPQCPPTQFIARPWSACWMLPSFSLSQCSSISLPRSHNCHREDILHLNHKIQLPNGPLTRGHCPSFLASNKLFYHKIPLLSQTQHTTWYDSTKLIYGLTFPIYSVIITDNKLNLAFSFLMIIYF